MSIRSNSNTLHSSIRGSPSSAIDFKDDFVNSTAVFAASHDETVSHILQRLDQLQSKISTQSPEAPVAPKSVTTNSRTATPSSGSGDLHSRISTLESIHEDTLHRLNSKLDTVERKLSDSKEAEVLMGKIASKFSAIESQLSANKEAEALMGKIASKFSQVEARLQSATQLDDRVTQLESRLMDRVSRVESRLPSSDLHSRVSKLESSMAPDPEQERILSRINAKLDQLEQRNKARLEYDEPRSKSRIGSEYDEPRSKSRIGSEYDEPRPKSRLGSEYDEPRGNKLEREERIEYLQSRIEKLKELRSKYEMEEARAS